MNTKAVFYFPSTLSEFRECSMVYVRLPRRPEGEHRPLQGGHVRRAARGGRRRAQPRRHGHRAGRAGARRGL